jgi:hypothetical protein
MWRVKGRTLATIVSCSVPKKRRNPRHVALGLGGKEYVYYIKNRTLPFEDADGVLGPREGQVHYREGTSL